MKKIFLTFADTRLQRSLERIARQAETMGCYDTVITTTERDLDPSFRIKFAEKLRPDVRGFGYWSWKPQIIMQILATAGDGDIVQYSDVGCHLNPAGKERLEYYFEQATISESGIVAFQTRPPENPLTDDGRKFFDLPEYQWIKGDLIDYFGIRENKAILTSQTIGATVMFVRNCSKSREIISQWLSAIHHDFSLIDDSPSKAPNSEGFIEHRHDQSIFSVLCKLYNIDTLSGCELYYPKKTSLRPDWKLLTHFPIHVKRDKQYDFITSLKVKINFICEIIIKKIKSYK